MLRQLARLTRPLPAAGPNALAVAVYAGIDDEILAAQESGFEGVACVDDAARLLGVLCDTWARAPLPAIGRWAAGVLEFVLWMQEPEGHWVNFVLDWDGGRNDSGITSATGENFWHARALDALSRAWPTFGDGRAENALNRGLEHAVPATAPSDVRALHVQVGLRLIREANRSDLEPVVRSWTREIVACSRGDVLMNNPDERDEPHLWAHLQEGVLAEAGVLLGDPDLVHVAQRSAEALLAPIVRRGFDRPHTTSYDVASAAFGLDRLAVAAGDDTWSELAALTRVWFDGRNPAGSAVYDRARGRVADGVDGTTVSRNSGAEANIEAAAALPDDAVASAPLAEPLLPSVPMTGSP